MVRVDVLWSKFWPDIEVSVKNVLDSSQSGTESSRREIQDLVEAVLVRVRNLEGDAINAAAEYRTKRLIEMITHYIWESRT